MISQQIIEIELIFIPNFRDKEYKPLGWHCEIWYKKQKQNIKSGGTKDVSAASIYRICFGPSELKLWHFLYFVLDFCTKIHNALKVSVSHNALTFEWNEINWFSKLHANL
ncbi:hypothetical protein BpHYR1_054170 [Brachionus plicatilis]|uniref:Uncharacterized protein n=1 Tax=Brachionus plicatilis TaxID=10195 RepID=A0A3M7S218_BRAPC|nr:hypothetical protein BpHYR1_054170 [Brachionus plicatilis]